MEYEPPFWSRLLSTITTAIIIIIITSDFVSIKLLSSYTFVLALWARGFPFVQVKVQALRNQGG
jgi:hypothetical protein